MKKKLKLLLVLPLYILLVLFNNCRNIFSNVKQNISLFDNVEFFNIAILVSLIAFGVIILLKNKTNKYNKILISSLLVILGTSILNGIFIGKNVSMFIVVYFYLLFISIVTIIITKQKFEISLVLGVSVVLLSMTVLAIFNLLFLVKYLILALIGVGLIIILFNIKNNKFYDSLEKMNNYGIVIFAILFLVAICGGINRYVHTYDEFSHWAFDAKAVIEYDKLSTCQEVVSRTRSYPPVITLWHYFVNIFIGKFIEQNLYIGLSIFITIFLMPAFSVIEKKNRILLPFLIIVIPFSCYLFSGVYGYETLYADLAFSAIFASSFIIYILYEKDYSKSNKYLAIILSILTLTKPTGFMLSISFVVILVLLEYFKCKNYTFKTLLLSVKKWYKLALLILAIFISWNLYIKVCDIFINDFYNFKLKPEILETDISYKLNFDVIINFLKNTLESFDSTIIFGTFKLSLFQFIILIFFSIFVIFNIESNKKLSESVKNTLSYFLGYILFFGLTLLSMFVMFSVYEAKELASFGRYLNSFNFAILIFIIVYICQNSFFEKNKIAVCTYLVVLIICIPFGKISYFISDYNERNNTHSFSINMQEKFKIINKNTSADSMIYVLDQQEKDGIMAMWYSRYYVFPRKVNASSSVIGWKLFTEKNKDDLREWGFTADRLMEHLKEYNFDYLFLYSSDEMMFQKLTNYFTDYEKSKLCTLFKINKDGSAVMLEPVE